MLPALVTLDQDDTVIRPAIQPKATAAVVRRSLRLPLKLDEAEFTQIAGNGINQQLIAAKLRWLEQNEPDNFKRNRHCVSGRMISSIWKLTGKKSD